MLTALCVCVNTACCSGVRLGRELDTYGRSTEHELMMPGIHVKHTHKVPYPVLIVMVVVGQTRIPLQLCHLTRLLEVKGLQVEFSCTAHLLQHSASPWWTDSSSRPYLAEVQ